MTIADQTPPTAPTHAATAVRCLGRFVPGKPAPQGSKRHVGNGILIESSKAVKPWRQDIREAFLRDGQPCIRFDQGVAVHITLTFVMPRPSGMPKRLPTPPHTKRPDVDKLERAVLDAIGSAGVWHDDSQVSTVTKHKRYAELNETPGCHIVVAVARYPRTANE